MNRKKFLKTASTGVLAASLLPLLSFKKNSATMFDFYLSEKEYKAGNSKKTRYILRIDPDLLRYFDVFSDPTKNIKISLESDPTKSITYELNSSTIETSDKHGTHTAFDCSMYIDKLNKPEDTTIEKNFTKNFSLLINTKKEATIVVPKGKEHRFLFSKSEDVPACFLTSATVFHKGLSDNCKELTILRNLREKVMKPNPKFSHLISEYEVIAPKMLININAASNKEEILESIYCNLVLPSVSLVENGKSIEAIEHYRDFVKEMKVLYL